MGENISEDENKIVIERAMHCIEKLDEIEHKVRAIQDKLKELEEEHRNNKSDIKVSKK